MHLPHKWPTAKASTQRILGLILLGALTAAAHKSAWRLHVGTRSAIPIFLYQTHLMVQGFAMLYVR